MKLLLREALVGDSPAIYAIADDYKDVHLDDYSCVTPDLIFNTVAGGNVYVFCDEGNYPIGFFAYEPHPSGLHAALHCIVRPAYLAAILRNKGMHAIIAVGFVKLGFERITARTIEGQTTANKILLSYGFKWNGYLTNETTVAGKKKDVSLFSLTGKYWISGEKQQLLPLPKKTVSNNPKWHGLIYGRRSKKNLQLLKGKHGINRKKEN